MLGNFLETGAFRVVFSSKLVNFFEKFQAREKDPGFGQGEVRRPEKQFPRSAMFLINACPLTLFYICKTNVPHDMSCVRCFSHRPSPPSQIEWEKNLCMPLLTRCSGN